MNLATLQENQAAATIALNDAILERWPIGRGIVYRKPNKQRQLATVKGVREGKLLVHVAGTRSVRAIALKSIIQPHPTN